jgi:hypothetical protein
MRNNQKRTGTKHNQDQDPPATETSSPLAPLEFVVPTEFVELPSRGEFYPEDHPLHKKESVEIKHMTAKEEDLLTSKTLIKKGIVLDRFLSSILLDKSIKTDSLLMGDKNALLVAARISGYGPVYETKVLCPSCGERSDFAFNLEEDFDLQEVDEEEKPELLESGNFLIELPVTGWEIECKLLTGNDERKMSRKAENNKKIGVKSDSHLIDQLRMIIVSISGHTDRATINQAIEVLPARDSLHLRVTYQKCVPNVDLTQIFTCGLCDHSQEMEVPLSADFFWVNS